MHLDTANPLFRKANTPWYDGNMACWIVLAAMLGLCLFSWAGIYVARANPTYAEYVWVPATMLGLSLLVAGSVAVRLFHRFYERHLRIKDL